MHLRLSIFLKDGISCISYILICQNFIIIQVKIFLIVTVIFYLTHYLFRSIILNFKYRNSQDFNVLFEIIVTDVA